jgi:hypothetical protein
MTLAYGGAVEAVNENDARSRLGLSQRPDREPACRKAMRGLQRNPDISHISDEELKEIMKSAVNTLYRLLWQRDCDPVAYNENLALGRRYTLQWDDPELKKPTRKGSRPK